MSESSASQFETEQLWIKAIYSNTTTLAKDILSKVSNSQKDKLLNSNLSFDSQPGSFLPLTQRLSKHFDLRKPFHLAAVSNSIEILGLFITQGCNINVVDKFGNNVIHMLCYIECLKPDDENLLVTKYRYLTETLKKEEIIHLLAMRNMDNLTPLQLASALGALGVFQEIFETKGNLL